MIVSVGICLLLLAAGGWAVAVRRRLWVAIARGLASDAPATRREAIHRPLEVEPPAALYLPYARRETDPELLELLALRVHSSCWGATTSIQRLGLRLRACRFSPGHFVLGQGSPLPEATRSVLVLGVPVPALERSESGLPMIEPRRS